MEISLHLSVIMMITGVSGLTFIFGYLIGKRFSLKVEP